MSGVRFSAPNAAVERGIRCGETCFNEPWECPRELFLFSESGPAAAVGCWNIRTFTVSWGGGSLVRKSGEVSEIIYEAPGVKVIY